MANALTLNTLETLLADGNVLVRENSASANKVKLTLTYPASTGRNFDEILRVTPQPER